MKRALRICGVVALGTLLSAPVMAGRVMNRQIKQQERIEQGVKSGELTGREAQALEREQRIIRKSKRQALSDGVVTKKERIRLEAQQDKASKHIYRLKHNAIQQP